MKKSLKMTSLGIIVLLSLIFSAAMAENDFMWNLIFAAVEKETGLTSDQLTKVQIASKYGYWKFSVQMIDYPEDEDGLLIGEIDHDGTLLSLSGPEKISLERQLERDLKSCFNQEDCYLRLSELNSKWRVKLAAVSETEIKEIWPRYLRVIELNITNPSEDAISFEDAKAAALRELAEAEGWPETYPDLFRLWCSAYYVLDGTPVYFFGLEWHSQFEEAYEEDAAIERYLKELENAFSKIHQDVPVEIGVLVNARTGALMEKPMIDFVPVQYHYLDFLIRTDEAVSGIQDSF